MAVTDHDTVASCRAVAAAAVTRGIDTVTGIEITAVEAGRDVHMLGYFFDIEDPGLLTFLAGQRRTRVARVERIAQRLDELGLSIDVAASLTAAATRGQSIG